MRAFLVVVVALVSLRDLAARLRAVEAARDPAPPPVLALAASPAPAKVVAREQDLEPSAPAWPEGMDYWLTHDAVKLAGILNKGGTYRWCRDGSLDLWRENGLYVGFSPGKIAALRAAGLLPEGVK